MPKVVDHDEKRAELAAASWSVIAEGGLGAATLRRVATAAGCTTGTVTHYFAGRQALLVDSLRAAHSATAERMWTRMAAVEGDVERLRAVVLEALPLDDTRMREWKVWLAFWSEALGNPELAAENARRYDEWRALLGSLLAPLTATPEACRHVSAILMAAIDGLGVQLVLLAAAGADPSGAQERAASDVLAEVDRLVALTARTARSLR